MQNPLLSDSQGVFHPSSSWTIEFLRSGDVPIPVPMPPPPIQKGLLQEVKAGTCQAFYEKLWKQNTALFPICFPHFPGNVFSNVFNTKDSYRVVWHGLVQVPTQLDEELAVLESVTSLPGSMRTSLGRLRGQGFSGGCLARKIDGEVITQWVSKLQGTKMLQALVQKFPYTIETCHFLSSSSFGGLQRRPSRWTRSMQPQDNQIWGKFQLQVLTVKLTYRYIQHILITRTHNDIW